MLEQLSAFASRVKAAIAGETGRRFAISSLTRMECLAKPMRAADLALQRHNEEGFRVYHLLELNEEAFVDAAQLRARFTLETRDALHLACAQFHRYEALWTNDDGLARAGHGLAVNIVAPRATGAGISGRNRTRRPHFGAPRPRTIASGWPCAAQ